MTFRVTAEEFERIAAAALERVPAELRARLEADNLMITIQSGATAADRDNDIDENVLGFYEGDDDSFFSGYTFPKRIVLLQRHLEDICRTRDELVAQVTDTVLHEVGHYFGMSHRDMRETRLEH